MSQGTEWGQEAPQEQEPSQPQYPSQYPHEYPQPQPFQTGYQSQYGQYPTFVPPQPESHRTRNIVIAIIAAIVLIGTIGLLAGGGGGSHLPGSPTKATKALDFNDPDFLAADVARVADDKQTDGSTVDVTCIHIGGTQFSCIGVWDDGSDNETTTVTVAADGQSWISS